ncbi:hypothetical protein GS518_16025 [Leptospira interrogans]|uniref:DUF4386 family protein n=5 Tax=Leptospira interrogans TaxID=173 RepID=Q72MI8_LEPIC|nr:hypothetical protein [Leptospira interrogans]AAS71744.1 conserved hypothetical protein [Leptospira interrogans serovar Copenhageni str. Fiocruz L1-130]ARB95836.1 hypothetical protein A6J42_10230 [Leptospira interrogans serovar Copenhageni]EKP24074.1 putative membrane protein [Leptospira interrogans serovar Icterohaemorrhagiae str. Verdun LP]EKP78281.1 putative membrane protein [Leptospira interrogans str. HAI1594]EMO19008.1 putative membrane protein [Leptospira interrogans serovar Copenhage
MKKQTFWTGILLIFAAITFWISWFLMPDPGTTDARHILEIVKVSRNFVWYSAITQIVSSVCYIIALFSLADLITSQKKTTLSGFVLFGIGVLGMCSDAFFHLLAYYMTDDSVFIQENVIIIMNFMQTKGVIILVPLLLSFFIGSLILSIGLKLQNVISKIPMVVFLIAIFAGIPGAVIINKIFLYKRSIVSLIILGTFAIGQAWIGLEIILRKNNK